MKIKLNEPKTLEFNVDTKGCSEKDLRGYLRFEFEDVEYGFPAIFESGTIKVKVPAFQSLLSNRLTESISNHKEVTVNARLDIVANGEAFVTPWNNEIDIEVPVDIKIKEEKSVITEKKKVNVNDPALFEAFDDAVKTSKIKDVLEKDVKPEVKVEEPEEKVDELTTPQKHQLKIAKKTLKMTGAMANVMGGMTKEEAREFLKSIGWSDKKIKKLEEEKEPEKEPDPIPVKKSRFAQSLAEIYVKEK